VQIVLNSSGDVIQIPDRICDLSEAFSSVMMDQQELRVLAAACTLLPIHEEAIVVEIGTYIGNTAVFLAKVLKELSRPMPIMSIDAFDRVTPDALNPQGVLSAYLENIRTNALEDVCMALVAFSADAAAVVADKIGLLLIDGGHTYPVVKTDLELYTPKVVQNGIVFIDDYGPAYPDVVRAANDFFSENDGLFHLLHIASFIVARRTSSSS
jgi:predicted O-methyltransferase YrrM